MVSAARRLDVQNVVFASSCNVYGRAPTTDIDETTDPAPLNPYARAKHEAEGLVEEFASAPGRTATILRLSTLYGYAPGIRFNLVVNDFVFRAVSDRPLTVYGDGTNWRPFMHVEDAARAFVHATCTPAAWEEHIYNVGGSDANYRIEEIAAIVRETVGSTGAVTYLAEEDPGPSYHVDFGRLESTDFAPTQTLRAGVQGLADRFTTETQHVRSA